MYIYKDIIGVILGKIITYLKIYICVSKVTQSNIHDTSLSIYIIKLYVESEFHKSWTESCTEPFNSEMLYARLLQ